MNSSTRETSSQTFALRAHLQNLLVLGNGRRLNVAALARQLGVTWRTAAAQIRALERAGMIRVLPFFDASMKPLLYLRVGSQQGERAFKGHCIELMISALSRLAPESSFSWWKTGRIRQIDLLVQMMQERIGFCFCSRQLPANRHWLPLARGFRNGVINRGYLLYQGSRAFIVTPAVQVVPLGAFLRKVEDWMLRFRTVQETRAERESINQAGCDAIFSPPARSPW